MSERVEQMRALAAQGLTRKAIAAALGCSLPLVSHESVRHGIVIALDPNAVRPNTTIVDDVRRLAAQGLDRRAIAAQLDRQPAYIGKVALQNGIALTRTPCAHNDVRSLWDKAAPWSAR